MNKILTKIISFGNSLADQIFFGKEPKIRLFVRSSANVFFDKREKLVKMGRKRADRLFLNIGQTKKFMQTILVASKCKALVEENRHASIRELYYQLKHSIGGSKENTFESQSESDLIIEDLELILDALREQLHLSADRKGYLYGNIVIEDSGDIIDCLRLGTGGWGIPSNVEDIKFIDVSADYVLVIETGAMFERLIEEKFPKKNNAILIATKGQASRGTRRLIHRLYYEQNLPVIVFTDGDPYGYYIYSVIKQGSINLAYLSKRLSTPKCKFVGMSMEDIKKYNLENVTERLSERDIKRAKEELTYPWFANKKWQKEINLMLKLSVRIEQQALANKSLDFVSKHYLPEKIENGHFLP